jgi:hypothetical protein
VCSRALSSIQNQTRTAACKKKSEKAKKENQMKKKSTSQSAFFSLSVLFGTVVFFAGVFLSLFATANSQALTRERTPSGTPRGTPPPRPPTYNPRPFSPVITHRFPYTQFKEAIELVKSGDSGKIVLDWSTLVS